MLTNDEIAGMLSRATFIERSCDPLFRHAGEDIRKLAGHLAEAENTIRDFAWRAECWSSVDIVAHVAEYFGVTVDELEKQMDAVRKG